MPMPHFTRQPFLLGEIRHTDTLTPFCRACRRRGRYALARLIARLGEDHPIMDWVDELRRTCPRWGAARPAEPCNIQVNELIRQFQGMGPRDLDDLPL